MMKRASWKEYQKQIAEDNYYYGKSEPVLGRQ